MIFVVPVCQHVILTCVPIKCSFVVAAKTQTIIVSALVRTFFIDPTTHLLPRFSGPLSNTVLIWLHIAKTQPASFFICTGKRKGDSKLWFVDFVCVRLSYAWTGFWQENCPDLGVVHVSIGLTLPTFNFQQVFVALVSIKTTWCSLLFGSIEAISMRLTFAWTDRVFLDLVPRCDSPAVLSAESPGHVDEALQAFLVAGAESGQRSCPGQCGHTHARCVSLGRA